MAASYRPEHVLVAGWVIYAAVFFVAPLEVLVPIEAGSLLFIAANCAAFAWGSRAADKFAGNRHRRTSLRARDLLRRDRLLFRATFTLGVIGNVLRSIDKYVMRGAWDVSGMDAREALLDTSTTIYGVVGAALYPFGYLPIFIYLVSSQLPRRRLTLVASLGLFLLPAIDAVFMFSRSFLLVSFAMVYFGAALTVFRRRRLSLKLIVPAIVATAATTLLSGAIFSWRLQEMQLNLTDSMHDSAYAFTNRPISGVVNHIEDGGLGSHMLSAAVPIMQYYVHSVLEFQILWENYDQQEFSVGAVHFAPYVKLLSYLGISSNVDLFELFPRVGVFTSFFGPLWVDFGWCSILFMLLFGFAARKVARGAIMNDVGALPLYTYICVVLFFAPVVNFLVSAQGMYVINAFVLFWWATRNAAPQQAVCRL